MFDPITDKNVSEGMSALYEQYGISPVRVANVVAFAIDQQEDTNVNEVTIWTNTSTLVIMVDKINKTESYSFLKLTLSRRSRQSFNSSQYFIQLIRKPILCLCTLILLHPKIRPF
jgi:hypothetical protein